MMFETKKAHVISQADFGTRIIKWAIVTGAFALVSLMAGIFGYRTFESLSWIDSLLNASMILGGMGEVTELKTDAGKIFASVYALYSGFFMIICSGLLLTPVFHRILHKFHSDK